MLIYKMKPKNKLETDKIMKNYDFKKVRFYIWKIKIKWRYKN